MKTCKVCKERFAPISAWAKACTPACSITLVALEKAKKSAKAALVDRKETKAKRTLLKSKAQWAREAQAAFNSFIRVRDADLPCISCGRHHQGQWHAGHYLSVGARPELRFDELNVHKQCQPCNTHLSGNAVLYRKGFIAKVGESVVDWLEGPHKLRKDTVDALKEIKRVYSAKALALTKAHA